MLTNSFFRTAGYSFPQIISIILVSLLLLFYETVTGTNYYFSSSIGDDSRTSTQAQNPATPWKTVDKLNSIFSILSAGDSVLFMKDNVFDGTITPTKSGTLSSPIIISSYGYGAKPIINGFQTVTGWTNEGSGIYSKSISAQLTPNVVTLNGVNTPLGRYPKTTYLSIDSHTGTTAIVDAATSSGTTNWTGAEVVIRKDHWIWDRCPVMNHSGTTISYTSPNALAPVNGYGFFFQQDLRCLTSLGDWAFKTGRLYMYFGANNPDSYTVKVSTIDRLVNLTGRSYITIEGLNLTGCSTDAVYSTGQHNTIKNCDISYIGSSGVFAWSGSTYITVDGCTISECQNRGVYGIDASPTIKNCYIHDIGMIRGMGGNGSTTYTGIALVQAGVTNSLVEYNRIDSIGYNGIAFSANNSIIRNNHITNYCNILDDGGGIYTGGSSYTGRKIYNNICINNNLQTAALGVFASEVSIEGIYLDASSSNVDVYNNTCAYNAMAGIFLHGSQNTNVYGNNCYGNITAQILLVRDPYVTPMANNNVYQNQFFSPKTTQLVLQHENTTNSTNDLSSFGVLDNNYYCRPLAETNMFKTILGYATTYKTFAQWKAYSGRDANSLLTPFAATDFLFEYATSNIRTVTLTGEWKTLANSSVSGSITLQPYTSIILIKSNEPNNNKFPTIQNQNFQLNENSLIGSSVGTVIASDPDAGQTKSFSIISGNTNGAFTINATTGLLTVANAEAINFEVTPTFALTVKVQDNGTGNLSSQATISIPLLNVNEIPAINNQTFSVALNPANGTIVGTVTSIDPDAGQTKTFSILSGNNNGAFTINPSTGVISVANSAVLDPGTTSSLVLVIKVQDNGSGLLSSQANITVNLLTTSGCNANGNVLYQVWNNIGSSSSINSLTSSINYPNNPTSSAIITSMEGTSNQANEYGSRIVGYICAPSTGSYTFWVASDNYGELWLSTNDQAANKQKIAYNTGSTLSREWNKYTTQKSVEINLVQGQKYYIEALMVEAYGGDNLAVGWLKPGQTGTEPSEVIPGSVLSPLFESTNALPVINNQSFSINENTASASTVGTVTATDPDAGQTKTYSIVSGNTNNAFAIDASSGLLTVANVAALNYEVTPTFALVIKVQDNGTGNLSSQATITVSLTAVNETPVITNQSMSCAEGLANGTILGTVVATDPDAGQTKTFSIISGNATDAFAINASNGVLTVANAAALNFEISPTYALVIKVQDNGTGNLSSQATITVSLTDVNETPVITNQSMSCAEGLANGTTLGTVVATDPDAGQTKTFSIVSGNANGAFAINATSGVLTVAGAAELNFETSPTYALVIKVQDNGTGILSSQATITVSLTDVNETPVVTNQALTLAEASVNGTIVGTVVATDPDAGQTLSYSITSGNAGNAFSINSLTGVLTVINSSAIAFNVNPSFFLDVKVSDNGSGNLSTNAVVSISVIPSPNQSPVITDQTFTIIQNSPTGTLVGTVEAADPDDEQILVYTILSGNEQGTFAINSTTGELSLVNTSILMLKSTSTIDLVIKVQDNGSVSLSNQAIVTVLILAANAPPVIQNQTKSTLEHQPIGTIVSKILATDPDSDSPLTYSITSGNISNGFSIDPSSGLLTINNPSSVCYEGNPIFNLSVKVQDIEGLSSEAIITINVGDINEKPKCSSQIFSISENAKAQTAVGAIVASDLDFNQTLTYSIVSGNTNNAFKIIPDLGLIYVNNVAALNFEDNNKFELEVAVEDNGEGNLSTLSTITIILADVNEPPVMENQALSVVENSAPGTIIGFLKAIDPDKGQSVKFMIANGDDSHTFSLNDTSGLISIADPSKLNYGRNLLITLTVIAQDNGIDSLSTLSLVTINILKDSTAIIQSEAEAVPVAEDFNESDISIYPNPTADFVNIDLEKANDKPVEIRIFTINGIEVYSSVTKGEKSLAINMADEKPGTYIALIIVDGQRYSKNIVVRN